MYKNKQIICVFSKNIFIMVATNKNFYIIVFKVWANYYKVKYVFFAL